MELLACKGSEILAVKEALWGEQGVRQRIVFLGNAGLQAHRPAHKKGYFAKPPDQLV